MTDAEKLRRAVEEGVFVGQIGDLGPILVAEIERLREEARRYYLADGTHLHMDTPELVVKARIEGARSIRDLLAKQHPAPPPVPGGRS